MMQIEGYLVEFSHSDIAPCVIILQMFTVSECLYLKVITFNSVGMVSC